MSKLLTVGVCVCVVVIGLLNILLPDLANLQFCWHVSVLYFFGQLVRFELSCSALFVQFISVMFILRDIGVLGSWFKPCFTTLGP